MRLLLVEDHVPLADELMAGLARLGYAVDCWPMAVMPCTRGKVNRMT